MTEPRPLPGAESPPADATLPDDQSTLPPVPRAPRRAPGLPAVPGYDVLRELGRGGMGVVYEARHLALDRVVALKMILRGNHAGPEDLARFRAEAEAVARLQHPHVVQVYEIGEYEGLPFIALEYCAGGSLHRKLSGQPVKPAEAARVVELLAGAMEAAHLKHIIHRDLKPHNVLLTEAGEPKITDFGLAKKLDAREHHTQTGVAMGTPSYMAPEQARGEKVGPAADVYALGAILYEMLTGRPPFLADTAWHILTQVLYLEPVAVRNLQPGVPRDLETICHWCLRKEPARRYASAAALADDLSRFRRGEPIKARPVGRLMRAWKWARRRPAVAGLSAGLLLTAAVGFGLVTWKWQDESEARALAEENQKQAERDRDRARDARIKESQALALARQREKEANDKKAEADRAWKLEGQERARAEANAKTALRKQRIAEKYFRKAQEAVDKMLTTVSEDARFLRDVPGFEQVRRKLLEQALSYHKEFLQDNADDPLVGYATAMAYYKVGDLLIDLGRHEEAEKVLTEGLAVVEKLVAAFPEYPELNSPLAGIHSYLGRSRIIVGRYAEAEPHLVKCLQLREKLAGREDATVDDLNDLATAHNDLALHFITTGKFGPAEKELLKAKEIYERLIAGLPGVKLYQLNLGMAYQNLASILDRQERTDEALPLIQEGVRYFRGAVRHDPSNPDYRLMMARSLSDFGKVLRAVGKLQEAEDTLAEARQTAAQLVKDFPTVPAYRRTLGKVLGEVAVLRVQQGDSNKAVAEYGKAIEYYEAVVSAVPSVADYRSELAILHHNLSLLQIGDSVAEAKTHAQRGVDLYRKLLEDYPAMTWLRGDLADSLAVLGSAETELRDFKAAADHFTEAAELHDKVLDENPDNVVLCKKVAFSRHQYGKLLLLTRAGDPETARLLDSALKLQRKVVQRFPQDPYVKLELACLLRDLGEARCRGGNRDKGIELFREAIQGFTAPADELAQSPATLRTLAKTRFELGTQLDVVEKTAEAAEEYESSIQLYRKVLTSLPKNAFLRGELADACTALGLLRLKDKDLQSAETWLREAYEVRRKIAMDLPSIKLFAAAAEGSRGNLDVLRKALLDECAAQFKAKKALSYYTACERLLKFDERSLKSDPTDETWKEQLAQSSFMTALAMVACGNYAEAVKRAEGFAELTAIKKLGHVRAGVIYAQSSLAASLDPRLNAEKRDMLREDYAKRAVTLLGQAVDAGLDDARLLREETAFDPLRSREDFRALLERLEKKQ